MNQPEQYFLDFYRIWGVGPTVAEKIAHWKSKTQTFISDEEKYSEEEILARLEEPHLQKLGVLEIGLFEPSTINIKPDAEWPTARDIFIEKWYWEHGVVSDEAGRLRFFTATYPEVLEHNNIDGMSQKQKLLWWEEFNIINGNELLIDPETRFY